MQNRFIRILLFFIILNLGFLFIAKLVLAQEINAKRILELADKNRAPWNNFEMKATLLSENNEKKSKEIFKIFFKNYTKTLVVYLSPLSQKGDLFLMVGDTLWYYVKDTRRPIRISPVQRLSDAASYGDLSRINWSGDYNVDSYKEQSIIINNTTYISYLLELNAISLGATYSKLLLWVDKSNFYPRKAEAYLQSGKLAKTLYFTVFENINGSIMNTEIQFEDNMRKGKKSILQFEKINLKEIPETYFLQSSLPDVSRMVSEE